MTAYLRRMSWLAKRSPGPRDRALWAEPCDLRARTIASTCAISVPQTCPFAAVSGRAIPRPADPRKELRMNIAIIATGNN